MPDATHWAAFVLAATILAVIPGPGMMYVLARSMADSTSAGLRSTAGTAVGGMFHVVGAVVGLSALLAASAFAFTVVRLAGAAYLIWLGVQTLRSAGQPPPTDGVASQGGRRAMSQGIVAELLNPKTAIFFLTFLPQFVQPANGSVTVQLLVLGGVSVALNSSADVVAAAFAGRLGSIVKKAPRWWRRQRIASGLVLISLGGAAAASGSRP